MKKTVISFLTIMLFSILFTACQNTPPILEQLSETDMQELLTEYNLDEIYLIQISIAQTHIGIDLIGNAKDNINASSIIIPVIKEYYDSVEIGDALEDNFRWGSLFLAESIGNWDIKIIDKYIITKNESVAE